ncbi:MAG: hypothetical protein JSS96_00720 [Bacteroidetes bacterium]|nr:hypothetical protein [Bacteroidota bacterium]
MENTSFRFVTLSFAVCFVYFLSCIPALTEYGIIFGDGVFRAFLSWYFKCLNFPFVNLLAAVSPLRGWTVFIIASFADCLLYAAVINALISLLLHRRKA